MTIEFIPCSTPGKFMSALKLLMTEFMTVLAGKGQLHGRAGEHGFIAVKTFAGTVSYNVGIEAPSGLYPQVKIVTWCSGGAPSNVGVFCDGPAGQSAKPIFDKVDLKTVLEAEHCGGPYEFYVAGYEKQGVNKHGVKDEGYDPERARMNLCFKIQTKATVSVMVNGKQREFPKHQYILNVHVDEVDALEPLFAGI